MYITIGVYIYACVLNYDLYIVRRVGIQKYIQGDLLKMRTPILSSNYCAVI